MAHDAIPSAPLGVADGQVAGGSSARSLVFWLVALALVFLRVPELLTDPRFMREEGVLYFRYAYAVGPFQALFHPHLDYVTLVTNAATVAARHWVSLENAPLVTTLAGMATQLLTVGLVIHGRAAVWRHPLVRFAGMLIILFASTGWGIWATTLSSQYVLSLVPLVLLIEPVPERGARVRRWATTAALLAAGTTGPASVILLPVFAWVAWRERSRGRWRQTLLLALCAAAQLALVLRVAAALDGPSSPLTGRFPVVDVELMGWVAVTRVLVPSIAGNGAAAAVGEWLLANRGGALASVVGFAGVATLVSIVVLLARRTPRGHVLGAVALCAFVLNTWGGRKTLDTILSPETPSIRYYLLPLAALGLLALSRLAVCRRGMGWLGLWIVVVTLVRGAVLYADPIDLYGHRTSWREEISAWRAGERTKVLVWPGTPHWSFDLAIPPAGVAAERQLLGPATTAQGEPGVSLQMSNLLFASRGKVRIEGTPGASALLFVHFGEPIEPWDLLGCTMHVPPTAAWFELTLPRSGVVSTGWPAPQAPAVGKPFVAQVVSVAGGLHASEAWRLVPGS